MALYRPIQISFWTDGDIMDYTPEEKYFYLYLLTNPNTSACGIYELPKRKIENETGYNRETVDKLLKRFVEYGKIRYDEETREVYILNWCKNNKVNNENLKKCVLFELERVKSAAFYDDLAERLDRMGVKLE